jgi:hypothetical protein
LKKQKRIPRRIIKKITRNDMKNELKVGIVIADSDEYAPIKDKIAELGAKKADFYAREGLPSSLRKRIKP